MKFLDALFCKLGLHAFGYYRSPGRWCDHYMCEKCGDIEVKLTSVALNCDHDFETLAQNGSVLEQKCRDCGMPRSKKLEPWYPF